jgi:hypothetical protein
LGGFGGDGAAEAGFSLLLEAVFPHSLCVIGSSDEL